MYFDKTKYYPLYSQKGRDNLPERRFPEIHIDDQLRISCPPGSPLELVARRISCLCTASGYRLCRWTRCTTTKQGRQAVVYTWGVVEGTARPRFAKASVRGVRVMCEGFTERSVLVEKLLELEKSLPKFFASRTKVCEEKGAPP